VDGDCLVCRELAGDIIVPGGLLWEEDGAVALHMPPVEEIDNPRPYIGHLLVVTRRHVARIGDLTQEEAAAVGRTVTRLARALVEAAGAEWVYSAVIGTRTPHFHQHLLPRYPGTPDEVPWHSVDEWEGARRGGPEEIVEVADRIRASFTTSRSP
jgi:histidine triad (HIT) family protein